MIRSPFFYVGDKYKLMDQLSQLMPRNINRYVDAFAGGGSAFLNVRATEYLVNDVDANLVNLHRELSKFADQPDELKTSLFAVIDEYQLSCSANGLVVPSELKLQYPKTYYAHFNRPAYLKLREDFNAEKNDYIKLYLLLIYGFNHMLRFNSSGNFNLPVGNVDFNKNVVKALENYLNFIASNKVTFHSHDYLHFIKQQNLGPNDFVYLDPPYLISHSEYNKLWDKGSEEELYNLLDELDARGVRFGLSNMLEHRGQTNEYLRQWSRRYHVHPVRSNYISFNDNTIKNGSKELYVTNHE